jgi:hypothetical protein
MMPEVLVALTRRRWWMVPILAAAVTLWAVGGLVMLPHAAGNVNQWDVFLGVFDAPLVVTVIVPIAFFSLTDRSCPVNICGTCGLFCLGPSGHPMAVVG